MYLVGPQKCCRRQMIATHSERFFSRHPHVHRLPQSSREPGPCRARYLPRDMLLLTTTARSSGAVVNRNMSRGKYLAREGPGSRLCIGAEFPHTSASTGQPDAVHHPRRGVQPLESDDEDDLWTLVSKAKSTGKKAAIYVGNLDDTAGEGKLRECINRRSRTAGIKPPKVHSCSVLRREDGELGSWGAHIVIDLQSLDSTVHSVIFSKTLFDFKKSMSGPIKLKFSGKTLNAILLAPICFWGVYF